MNWNLKDIYKTEADFQNAQKEIQHKLKEIEEYKGR